MNSEELEQSLKAEFENQISRVVAELKQQVADFQSSVRSDLDRQRAQIDEAFEGFTARFDSKTQLDGGFSELISEHLKLARDAGAELAATAYTEAEKMETPAAEATSAGFAELRDAIADISSQDSQSAILKALVDHASTFAPRGAFFIIKNEHFAGWRTFGEDVEANENTVREIHFPTSANSILGTAIESRSSVEASHGAHTDDGVFLNVLNFGQPDRMYAIPLVARGRGVAVLYADYGNEGVSINTEALETLVKIAGMTVEMLAGAPAPAVEETPAAVQPVEEQPQPQSQGGDFSFGESYSTPSAFETLREPTPFTRQEPVDAAPAYEAPAPVQEYSYTEPAPVETPYSAPEPEPQAETPYYQPEPEPVPEPVVQEEVYPQYEARPEPQPEPPAVPAYEPVGASIFESTERVEAPEVSASPFERTVEPFEPAHAIGGGGGGMSHAVETVAEVVVESAVEVAAPAAPRARLSDRPVDLPIEVPQEERRLHTDARRFARLLVSEIKLYNEKKVLEGRQAGDLYDRLREAIDRSREMYDKRVQPPVAAKFDYFHYELVNSLGEGDAGKFGSNYPGAVV